MAGSGMVRTILIVGGTTVVAAVAGGMVAVPPLLASAAPGTAPTPVTSTPVTSATPVPEPTRAPVDWDTLSEKEEAALFEGQNAQGTALALVQETYPDDFAYGYMLDGGFGIGFKADAPAEALTILDAVGDPYELHESVGFNEFDLQPQLSRAVDLVQQAVGESGMSAAANVFTVTVEIELYPDAGDADPVVLDGAALHALEDDIRAVLYPGFDVEITQVRGVQIGF